MLELRIKIIYQWLIFLQIWPNYFATFGVIFKNVPCNVKTNVTIFWEKAFFTLKSGHTGSVIQMA